MAKKKSDFVDDPVLSAAQRYALKRERELAKQKPGLTRKKPPAKPCNGCEDDEKKKSKTGG